MVSVGLLEQEVNVWWRVERFLVEIVLATAVGARAPSDSDGRDCLQGPASRVCTGILVVLIALQSDRLRCKSSREQFTDQGVRLSALRLGPEGSR